MTLGNPGNPVDAAPRGGLARLDAWMADHPWHPRLVPFIVYVALLLPIDLARDYALWTYPLLYVLQCGLTLGLLWRYRRLLPELNGRFHWLALPVGAGVCAAWIALGQTTESLLGLGEEHPLQQHYFVRMEPPLRALSLGLRLLGMSIVVPLFEELFVRSLLLRSLQYPRRVAVGLMQLLEEVPLLGDWLLHTPLAQRADHHERVFEYEFNRTELGQLTWFGVLASTVVFALHHVPRDWAGSLVCGVAYCLLLAATRQRGLGPVIWAHGLTNALLWGYCVYTGDWRFL